MTTQLSTEPVHLIEIGHSESIRLAGYGVVLSFLALGAGAAVLGGVTTGATSFWLMIPALLVTIAAHEAVHGAFFKAFGGNPTFGVGVTHFLPYAYATSTGDRFTPRQMNIIAVAPLFIVTSAAIGIGFVFPTLAACALLGVVVNVGGAIGDLWMMVEMRRFTSNSEVVFEDTRLGLAVYSDDPAAGVVAARLAERSGVEGASGFMGVFTWTALVLAIVTTLIPVALATIGTGSPVIIGPDWFAVVKYLPNTDGFVAELNLAPAFAGALAFTALYRNMNRGPRSA